MTALAARYDIWDKHNAEEQIVSEEIANPPNLIFANAIAPELQAKPCAGVANSYIWEGG